MNVVQIEFFSFLFFHIILALVFLRAELFLTVQSIVVNRDLTISSHYNTLLCHYQRVNFDHVTVILPETIVNFFKKIFNLRFFVLNAKITSYIN
jgi:hypothetical protein